MDTKHLRRRRDRIVDAARTSLWPLPVASVLVSTVVAMLMVELDRTYPILPTSTVGQFVFQGDPQSARGLVSVFAGSLMTVTSLVFSLTVLALQLGSSQASPRLLRMFASDRVVQRTLSIFLGTFMFSITIFSEIRTEDDAIAFFVPRLAVTANFVMMIVSIVALVLFIAHLARLLRVETMLRDVHRETNATLQRVFSFEDGPKLEAPPIPDDAQILTAAQSGFLTSVDRAGLVALAVRHDLVISIETSVGHGVVADVPIGRWWRAGLRDDDASTPDHDAIGRQICAELTIGYERTMLQDIGFGLRQEVDICARALSPGVNDPTTAVHALGHISAILCDLVSRELPHPLAADDDGNVRFISLGLNLREQLEVGIVQPRDYGCGDLQVAKRLLRMVQEIAWRNVHPDLEADLRIHADAIAAAALTHDRPNLEKNTLRLLREAVDDSIAGSWKPTPN